MSYFGDPRPDIQQIVGPRAGRVLDVGCGEGALGHALKESGAACVVGVEADPAAAAVARERLDALVEGDAGAVDLPPGPFDWIVFADVLEHLPDPDAVLARYTGLLGPGGSVVVSLPNYRFWSVLGRLLVDRWSYTDSGVRDRTHLRVFTRRSALRLVEDAGLRVTRLERKYRLFEDQSSIGRVGALATRAVAKVAPWVPGRELLCFQYVVVATK